MQIQILCIIDKTSDNKALLDVLSGFVPVIKNSSISILDFYTMDMDELALIAKHRIVSTPTILVFLDNKVIARVANIKDTTDVVRVLHKIQSSQ